MKYNYFLFILFFSFMSSLKAQWISEAGNTPLPSTFDMDYASDHLVISQQGLKIFDVTDPANASLSGQASYPGNYAYQIKVNGSYAYLAEGANGYFSVYDISDLTSPVLTGSVMIPSTEYIPGGDMLVKNNIAYMTGSDSLYVIDVSDPATPAFDTALQVTTVPFGTASAIVDDDRLLFILTTGGIQLFDITNPHLPSFVRTINTTHQYQSGLAIDTLSHILFSPWSSSQQTYTGYDAFDISNPPTPQLIFSDSTGFAPGTFGAAGFYNSMLAISVGGGLNLFNVNSLSHHFVTSYHGTNVQGSTVAVNFRDSTIYNARVGGFEILRLREGTQTAVDELPRATVVVYPNPANSVQKISLSGKNILKAEISDLSGKIISEYYTDEIYSPASPGIYFLKLAFPEQVQITRIVVK